MPLLDVKGLTKTFGGLTAINHVDFTMEEHQIVSVIGPNGAGKTTFFNMISGYYPVDSGTIMFNGHSLTKLTPEKVAAFKIARTFQNIRLFQNMLVAENILVGCYMEMKANIADVVFRSGRMRREEQAAYDKVVRLLDYVGLSGKEGELARNLSYGQQRRLEIARALAIEPKLLLLDEPAAGLNPKETEEMKQFILQLRTDMNTTILLIEHDMKLVMGLSDKITVLNYGEKIADGTPDEIRNNENVIKAYLGVEEQDEDDFAKEVLA
ncbi:MAG TPA: ABC transporter ATP-binding protein [Candidatus Limiplasma sp.]|nr:ABC transporter ATP-binding protein [Candidatus Limiplasma sp.]HPS81729.1 ABC transporter ATP-binding protein [Candidatus Limiplasma sp.]